MYGANITPRASSEYIPPFGSPRGAPLRTRITVVGHEEPDILLTTSPKARRLLSGGYAYRPSKLQHTGMQGSRAKILSQLGLSPVQLDQHHTTHLVRRAHTEHIRRVHTAQPKLKHSSTLKHRSILSGGNKQLREPMLNLPVTDLSRSITSPEHKQPLGVYQKPMRTLGLGPVQMSNVVEVEAKRRNFHTYAAQKARETIDISRRKQRQLLYGGYRKEFNFRLECDRLGISAEELKRFKHISRQYKELQLFSSGDIDGSLRPRVVGILDAPTELNTERKRAQDLLKDSGDAPISKQQMAERLGIKPELFQKFVKLQQHYVALTESLYDDSSSPDSATLASSGFTAASTRPATRAKTPSREYYVASTHANRPSTTPARVHDTQAGWRPAPINRDLGSGKYCRRGMPLEEFLTSDRSADRLGAFARFLTAEYTEELLHFWLAVWQFKATYDSRPRAQPELHHENEPFATAAIHARRLSPRDKKNQDLDTCSSVSENFVTAANLIYHTYLQEGCEQQVNIEGRTAKKIKRTMDRGRYSPDMFDEPFREVNYMLASNHFPRFQLTLDFGRMCDDSTM